MAPSSRPDSDVYYTFAQVGIYTTQVGYSASVQGEEWDEPAEEVLVGLHGPRQCTSAAGKHGCYASSGRGSPAAVAGHNLDCGCGSQQEKGYCGSSRAPVVKDQAGEHCSGDERAELPGAGAYARR